MGRALLLVSGAVLFLVQSASAQSARVAVLVDLIGDGSFETADAWSDFEDAECEHDIEDGRPAPSLACSTTVSETGEVFCSGETPTGGTSCWSSVFEWGRGGAARQVRVPPVHVGGIEGGPGQEYELQLDYALSVEGEVRTDTPDASLWGDGYLRVLVGVRRPGESEILWQEDIGQVWTFSSGDSGRFSARRSWKRSHRFRVTESIAGRSGSDVDVLLLYECQLSGSASATEELDPVELGGACSMRIDNVILESVVRAP